MDIFRGAERLMGMNDETWERHANPLSVYSRFSCLPLIVAAIWSRVWLGWWALAPLALAIGWTFINPRLFPAPLDKGTIDALHKIGFTAAQIVPDRGIFRGSAATKFRRLRNAAGTGCKPSPHRRPGIHAG